MITVLAGMLTGHNGSLRLPRRRRHLLVTFVSCLRPVFIPVSALAGTEPPLAKPPSVTASIETVCSPSIDGSNRSPAEKLPDSSRRCFGLCRKHRFQNPANGAHRLPRKATRTFALRSSVLKIISMCEGGLIRHWPRTVKISFLVTDSHPPAISPQNLIRYRTLRANSAGKLPLQLRRADSDSQQQVECSYAQCRRTNHTVTEDTEKRRTKRKTTKKRPSIFYLLCLSSLCPL